MNLKAQLTGENGQPPHGGERVIPRRVQDVQLVQLSPDAVKFPVEVLDGRRVLVVKPLVQKPGDDCGFAHFGGAQDDHPVAVLGRDVELVLGRGHFLDHGERWWWWVLDELDKEKSVLRW